MGGTFTAEVRIVSATQRRIVATYTVTFDTELPLIESLRRDPRLRSLISQDQDYILPFSINSDGSYSSQRDPRLGTLSYLREANNRLISSAVANGNNITELGLGNMTGQALNHGQRGLDIVGEAFSCSDLEASDLQAQQDGTFSILSQPDRPVPFLSYSSPAVTGRIYASDETIPISINLESVFDSTARHINMVSQAVTRAAISFMQESFFEPLLQSSSHIPFNLRQQSELELSRRQHLFAQSQERRLTKMLAFDAAAPSGQQGILPKSTMEDIQSPQDFSFSSFASFQNLQYDIGAAMNIQQTNPVSNSPSSKVSNPNTRNRVSIANNATVQTPVSNSVSSYVKNSSSTKTDARTKTANAQEARARATNSASNFKIHTPMSEGKTQARNAETVHAQVQNAQKALAAQKSAIRATIQQAQAIGQQVQSQTVQAQSLQEQAEVMQPIAQPAQTEAQQIAHEQPIAQPEQAEAQQAFVQQEQVAATTHQEHAVQAIVQEPQLQTRPVAAQRIRSQKKKAGEKILPRIPISVSANADNGKNKKENSMNSNKKETALNANSEEKEKNAPVAQIVKPVPRRIIPAGIVAFLPLRNLFENKNKKEIKKEKNPHASKVCGWCGRKAA